MYIISGDMESRTGILSDYIENDSTRHVPLPDDYIRDSPMHLRANMDTVVNSQGKCPIGLCRMCNLRILNGRVGSDKEIGHYTCYTYNGTSCVDYVLYSPQLIPFISDFDVGECMLYSDHCAIYVSIFIDSHCHKREPGQRISKLIWDNDKIDIYHQNLASNKSVSKFKEMLNMIEYHDENADINGIVNGAVECFNEGIRNAADPLFLRSFPKGNLTQVININRLVLFGVMTNGDTLKRLSFLWEIDIFVLHLMSTGLWWQMPGNIIYVYHAKRGQYMTAFRQIS